MKCASAWLLALCSIALPAAPVNRLLGIRPITVDDGLSQSHVTAIVQDRHGFVWIGTAVGLNRYDGHDFAVYTHKDKDSASLSSNAIYALHVDRGGALWVGTDRGLDRYEAGTDAFRHFSAGSASSPIRVRALDSDSHGNVWASIRNPDGSAGAIVRMTPASGHVLRFTSPLLSHMEATHVRALDDQRIVIVMRDPTGRFRPTGFAICVLNPGTGEMREIVMPPRTAPPVAADERDISLAQAGPSSFWIGAPGSQIFFLSLERGDLRPFTYDQSLSSAEQPELVSHVVEGQNGVTWVLPTRRHAGGRPGGNTIHSISKDGRVSGVSAIKPAGACDLNRSFVISSLIDGQGTLWAGISGSGLCVADLESGLFSHVHESSPDIALSNNFVKSVGKTREGVLWVATQAGLDRIDRSRREVRRFPRQPGAASGFSKGGVRCVFVSRDQTLWVGTQWDGLNRSIGQTGAFEQFRHNSRDPTTISSDTISSLTEDRNGTLWIATSGGGLNRFDPPSRSFVAFRHNPDDPGTIQSDFVNAVVEDSLGNMWVATEDAGLSRFDRASGRFSAVQAGPAGRLNVLSLAEDPVTQGVVWMATLMHGLFRYDQSTGKVTHYSTRDSTLPSDAVYSVLSDGERAIWAGTNRGLVRIDARSGSFRIFGPDQGVQSMEYNTRACFRAADGELFFGGVGGLNFFYPREITQNSYPAKVLITSVRALNRSRGSSPDPYRLIMRVGLDAPAGELDSGTRDLVFNFVALHYSDPGRSAYRFRLDGFDGDWRDAGALREITYTNLPPGPYTFRVKAVTSRGVWSEQEAVFGFAIARPFNQTIWFAALVLFGVFAAGYLVQRLRSRKLRLSQIALEAEVGRRTRELSEALNVIEQQAGKLRESDALKSRFVTNVSHDFRTPLTVTLGTLEDVRAGFHGPVTEETVLELETVIRNERKLLRLVNQLLAIARIDSGKLRLRVAETDIAEMARDILEAFAGVARRKGIFIEFGCSGPILAFCDHEWMEVAMTNLVANAVKFSPAGGHVRVSAARSADGQTIRLSVQDEGPGIPPEEVPKVFDRFYQTDVGAASTQAGVGLGLSLVKEIVELHGGRIEVQSDLGKGSLFEVVLSAGSAHFPAEALAVSQQSFADGHFAETLAEDLLAEEESDETAVQDVARDKPLLVIAEDNKDLRSYLVKHLQGEYRLLAVERGDEAWSLIRSEVPDLIVSDIMMPGMDGCCLLQELRKCPETDFIPIIFLTAKATAEDRILGLESGVDDYLAKPFEIAELKAKIRNILDSRARLGARIAASLALDAAKSAEPIPESSEAAFVRRVYDKIRERAPDQDFSVEQLAEELAMSRMHLFRKLRSILGKSPADVLIEYRLERAAQLLGAKAGNVSEIAYSVGFKNISHFTRRFREQFGLTPSEYRAGGGRPGQPNQAETLRKT